MNVQIDQLVKSLLQKDSLEQCSLQELEQFASRHPYFGAAQLLLTKKMKMERSEGYDEQLQKTFLFFHNPLWVEQLLEETGQAIITQPEKEDEQANAVETVEKEEAVPTAPVLNGEPAFQPEQAASEFEFPEPEIPITDSERQEQESPVSRDDEKPFQMPTFKAAEPDDNSAMVFEPYHTVDYFASQGIKLKLEEKPLDKFGQQLRSFTDWLKTMKKLPATEIAIQTEAGAEKKVEQLAEHSIQEREVVTEAMAAVWEKQGNRSKALDIYHKLSLLEPSKSAYFAAKIEDLKNINT